MTKSYERAVEYYTKAAANQGDKDALNNLGLCYKKGEGVSERAVEY